MDALNAFFKQPFWVIVFLIGAFFAGFPFISVDKDNHFISHPPNTLLPVVTGFVVMGVSLLLFWYMQKVSAAADATGLDLRRVKESDGVLSTNVNGCEIRVVYGRIEKYPYEPGTAVVLPCNEYFDDRCVGDTRSALGAYANQIFDGQVEAFGSLIREECRKNLGNGVEQQKTKDERAESFGVGKCVLIMKPLGKARPIALISTTTQRSGEGLAARISYMFDGMLELFKQLADARIREVVMPVSWIRSRPNRPAHGVRWSTAGRCGSGALRCWWTASMESHHRYF
jgi:hypothetical protein